jgi:hypothetical protein
MSRILSEPVDYIEVTDTTESNTALVIKADVKVESGIKKLFIKTMKHIQTENVYHKISLQEGKFYKFITEQKIKRLPIPVCYDAFVSEEKGTFFLVLEDISERYAAPASDALTSKDIWFSCADALAKFHAVFWNNGIIPQDEDGGEYDAREDRACLRSFLNDFNDRFDKKTKTILANAMEINISLINNTARRIRNKNNVTVCNGDSHIYNFMIPVDRYENPLIIDFQFWGEGIGTGDLAHLTRVNFSDKLKKAVQIPIIEHYYKSLIKYGVTGYSWDDCFRDYRISAASMVLIPLWQYTGFKLKYEEWRDDLQGLIYNYEYLMCDELCNE